MTIFLPSDAQPFIDPRTGQTHSSWRRWMVSLTDTVNAWGGGAVDPTPPPVPELVSFVVSGAGSVTADGSVSGGEFVVTLVGDSDNPPLNSFYGVTTAGDKGFVPLYSGLEEGAGIAIRDSGYIVIESVGTPEDLPLTGNAGEAVRVTDSEPGLYAWDGAAFTLDPAADGAVSIALAPLVDAGTGTALKKIVRDSYGRVSATETANAVDLPYDNATSGLTSEDVQAAIDEVAGIVVGSGAWTVVKKTADQSRSSTTTKTADSELSVPLGANKTYHARGVLYFTITTANGYAVDLDYSGTTSYVQSYRDNFDLSKSIAATNANFSFSTNDFPSAGNGTGAANVYLRFAFDMTITTSTAGSLRVRWAQFVSSSQPTILRRGSYFEILEF